MLHDGLVGILISILYDVGVPDMVVVTKARGLRAADASRSRDDVVLDFFAEGRHLVADAVVMTVYRNTILKNALTTYPAMLRNMPRTASYKQAVFPRSPSRQSSGDLISLFPLR
jgi:hypothetical protein